VYLPSTGNNKTLFYYHNYGGIVCPSHINIRGRIIFPRGSSALCPRVFPTLSTSGTRLTLMSSPPPPPPPPDEDSSGGGGEESGSGCDSPSCDTDQDIYFSTPPNPGKPADEQRVKSRGPSAGGPAAATGSTALALCGLALALLAPHLR